MNNADMPATPIPEEQFDRACDGIFIATGLTKREHFAAMAMQGLLTVNLSDTWDHEYAAEMAIGYADALLAALEQGQ